MLRDLVRRRGWGKKEKNEKGKFKKY